MSVPATPKIYHIVHVDRLPSIIAEGFLWCDKKMVSRSSSGTAIGLARTLSNETTSSQALTSLYWICSVGACVPFYFCPRSIMLYVISSRPKILI